MKRFYNYFNKITEFFYKDINMRSIKKLKIFFNQNFIKRFELPTDIKILDIDMGSGSDLIYVSLDDDFIYYLKKWMINNPITKYPLISNYYVFYNNISETIIYNDLRTKLSEEDSSFFKLLSAKYCYENIDELGDKAISGILNSPEYCFLYADQIISERLGNDPGININDRRFIEGEKIILMDPKYSYYYISNVIYYYLIKEFSKDKVIKILESEYSSFLESIFRDSIYSYFFITNIIKGPYEAAESAILNSFDYGDVYILKIVYPSLMNRYDNDKNKVSMEIRNRYKDYERDFIFKFSSKLTLKYFLDVVMIPDIKIESLISENVRISYLTFIIKYYAQQYEDSDKKGNIFQFIRSNINKHSKWISDHMNQFNDKFIKLNIEEVPDDL